MLSTKPTATQIVIDGCASFLSLRVTADVTVTLSITPSPTHTHCFRALQAPTPRFHRNLAAPGEAPDAGGRRRGGKPREFRTGSGSGFGIGTEEGDGGEERERRGEHVERSGA